MMDGIGTYNWQNQNVYYYGPFVSNKREGIDGIMRYEDGTIYIGEFKNDMRHGKGSLRFPNKDRYEGNWIEDNKDGEGVYYFY